VETQKEYLGDSVYVEDEGFQLRLYTDNGMGPRNEIYLEYDAAFLALLRWVQRVKHCKIEVTEDPEGL